MKTKPKTHAELEAAWESDPLAAATAAADSPRVHGATTPAADWAWLTGTTLREAQRDFGEAGRPTYEVEAAGAAAPPERQVVETVLGWIAEQGRETP